MEQGIEGSVSNVKSAKCPSDVKSEEGAKFTCDVTFASGATGNVQVTQTSGSNTFTYTLEQGSVRIPGSDVEAQIQKDLAQQGVQDATVSCPSTVAVKVGTTVTCNVSGARGAGQVTFTFESADGTVDAGSVKTS